MGGWGRTPALYLAFENTWFFFKKRTWNCIFLTEISTVLTTYCSQNHRTAMAGRDLRGQLVTQGIAQDNVQMSRQHLNISKDGDTTTSLGNLLQSVLGPSDKKCFLLFTGNILCFTLLVPTAPCSVIKHHWKEPGCIFFCALHSDYLYRNSRDIPERSCHWTKQSWLSQLLLMRDTSDPATSWWASDGCSRGALL